MYFSPLPGDCEIKLVSASSASQTLGASEEGMAAIYLEAEDVEGVLRTLKDAGYETGEIKTQGGRRVLAIDPKISNAVPLFIFDRRA